MFTWTTAAENAFQQLKTALTTAPILVYPDFTRQFILSTDASHTAIGYVLGQRDDAGRERDIAYGGRALRGAEIRYGITEKETLALVDGIRHFKVYLTHAKFLVYTDHSATKFLQNTKDPTGRLGRWALFLQSYQYDIVHKPGRIHNNADALSRMPHSKPPPQDSFDDYEPPTPDIPPAAPTVSVVNDGQDTDPAASSLPLFHCHDGDELPLVCGIDKIDNDELRQMQLADPQSAPFMAYAEDNVLPPDDKLARRLLESQDYVMDNGLLFHLYYPRGQGHRTERLVKQLVVPFPLRNDILLSFHDSLLGGHFATERTYQSIRLRYFWIGMYADITTYVKTCGLPKGKESDPSRPPNDHTPADCGEQTVFTMAL